VLSTLKAEQEKGHRTLQKATLINAAFNVGSEGAMELGITDPMAFCLFAGHPAVPEATDLAACQQTVIQKLIHTALFTVTVTSISRITFIEQLSVEGM